MAASIMVDSSEPQATSSATRQVSFFMPEAKHIETATYSAPIRALLTSLRDAYAKAHSLAETSAFFEHKSLAETARLRLLDHETMYARACNACGEPNGTHGRDLLCLCGCTWEHHTKIREFTPRIQNGTFHRPDGTSYQVTLGETPFERRFCSSCRTARFREAAVNGVVCASWETPAGAESCLAIRETQGVFDKRSWFTEYGFHMPTQLELDAWLERQRGKEAAAERIVKQQAQSVVGDARRLATAAEVAQMRPAVRKTAERDRKRSRA